MKQNFILAVIISLLFPVIASAQQTENWPKTLLWRISGKGIPQNSYLYGTIHLQDKRLFYFTDSLYHYLEAADGFAMEIDMQEFTDSLVQKLIDQREDELSKRMRTVKADQKKKVIDSLIDNVIERQDKASKTQLMILRQQKMKKALKHNEMATIMDGYLFGIARRQGKWTGGIEDVQDQLSLFDELGADVTHEELTAPDEALSDELEKMVSIYQSADLNKLEDYTTNSYSPEREDMILIKRNIKMADRMDSMANIRSMFFAVGAAHLPGKTGVINELRKRGYRVDPVFSSTRIDPVKYAAKLREAPWTRITDEKETYSVEMPGRASDLGMYNDYVKMKFYIDISTLTFFMSGSMVSAKSVDLNKVGEELSRNTEATIVKKRMITRDGMKGVEFIMYLSSFYYKVQYLFKGERLYMLMAGSDKEENTESADVNKFFQSFAASEKPLSEAPPEEWTSFGLKDKAFTVMLPGVAHHNTKIEAQDAGSNWKFTAYDCIDDRTGVYILMQVRDIQPGFYLPDDSSYFLQLRESMKKTILKVDRDTAFTVNTFPAYSFEGRIQNGSIIYKTLSVDRGNRVYFLVAGGPDKADAIAVMDKFLQSLTFTDYEAVTWKKESAPKAEFSTIAPAPFKEDEKKNDEVNYQARQDHYFSYNKANSVSYEVFRKKLSPYYWVANDSLFFDEMGRSYNNSSDSVLTKTRVFNGKLRGMEWLVKMPASNNLKKFRQILNGDTLYTLISFIPAQYIDEKEQQQFFDGFSVAVENTSPTIFNNKAARLLNDLQSSDSATFAEAGNGLMEASFSKEDLPLLHKALITSYPDDTTSGYYNTRTSIIRAMADLADSSTIAFIRQQYPLLKDNRESLKFDLLNVLARYKSRVSYSALKELLLSQPPKRSDGKQLGYYLDDSLELTGLLFPEILKLSNDSLFAYRIVSLAYELLDSNRISAEMLSPYEKNFIYMADTAFAGLKKSGSKWEGYSYLDLVRLLGHFRDAQSNRVLQTGLLVENLTLKEEIIMWLLKNNQPVAAREIEKIAADDETRRDFYELLLKAGKQKLFPAKYLTQQYMAASDMYEYAADDDTPEEVTPVGSKIMDYQGETRRFYLFKIVYVFGDGNGNDTRDEYLGIAGPYNLDVKKLDRDDENTVTGMHEEFDAKKIDQAFKEYMKDQE